MKETDLMNYELNLSGLLALKNEVKETKVNGMILNENSVELKTVGLAFDFENLATSFFVTAGCNQEFKSLNDNVITGSACGGIL
jgi:hypothetical protein